MRCGILGAGVAAIDLTSLASSAGAEQRAITVTLLDGKLLTLTVDVPPGTPLDQIRLPQIDSPILRVQDRGPLLPPPVAPQPGPTTDGRPAKHADHRRRARRPKTRDATHAPAAAPVSEPRPKRVARRAEKEERRGGGTPTPPNPTYSFALPGPAPVGVPNFFIDKFRIPPFLLPIYQAAGSASPSGCAGSSSCRTSTATPTPTATSRRCPRPTRSPSESWRPRSLPSYLDATPFPSARLRRARRTRRSPAPWRWRWRRPIFSTTAPPPPSVASCRCVSTCRPTPNGRAGHTSR